jgi:hypothetical protein
MNIIPKIKMIEKLSAKVGLEKKEIKTFANPKKL